ncbi:MAG: hypothetical protein WCJ80_11925 [Bacteroidota bacterium]
MKNLTIKKIFDYSSKTETSKTSFLNKLKSEVQNESTDSRNYWHRSLTAISKSFKTEDKQCIIDRIEAIESDKEASTNRVTMQMYDSNLRILYNFIDFDFSVWKPQDKINFISQRGAISTIVINGTDVKIHGDDLFVYKRDDKKHIGAIWFVAKKNGYRNEDLALFTDGLFRLLKFNFSDEYVIDPDYCLAVDVFKVNAINYSQILNYDVSSNLLSIIDEIKKRM